MFRSHHPTRWARNYKVSEYAFIPAVVIIPHGGLGTNDGYCYFFASFESSSHTVGLEHEDIYTEEVCYKGHHPTRWAWNSSSNTAFKRAKRVIIPHGGLGTIPVQKRQILLFWSSSHTVGLEPDIWADIEALLEGHHPTRWAWNDKKLHS